MDSIHVYAAKGDIRAADSLVRSHAQDYLDSSGRDVYAAEAIHFIAGNLDTVLSLLADDHLSVQPMYPHDPDLGLVLGYEQEAIDRRIDSGFGNSEAAAVLKLIRLAMTEFAPEYQPSSAYDPDWCYTWKISPATKRLNDMVLEHLSRYGRSPYGRALSEKIYFSMEKHKVPMGFNFLEGGGWMDGRDAGPIWWRSTSFDFEYRFPNLFAYLKYGRAVSGLGLAYYLLDTQAFALSPYAGISRYPSFTNGEYKFARQYFGPDLGLNFDWKFKIWKPPRALLNLYMRSNAGVVIDPDHFSAGFQRTSFVYLNLGLGINLDIFAQYTPYVRNGRIKFHRELNWR